MDGSQSYSVFSLFFETFMFLKDLENKVIHIGALPVSITHCEVLFLNRYVV